MYSPGGGKCTNTLNLYTTVDNIVISKLLKPKANSKYFIGHLDKIIRPLVLIMPKISGCIKAFKVKDGDKNKTIN